MKSVGLLAALLLGVTEGSRFTSHQHLDQYTFDDYLRESGKLYPQNEYTFRSSIFNKNLKTIKEHNAKNLSWKMGVNKFTDLTEEELLSFFGSDKYSLHNTGKKETSLLQGKKVKLPESVDWRERYPTVVSAVKDQGSCGSCWYVFSPLYRTL
jgi:C1A family cysteine protease